MPRNVSYTIAYDSNGDVTDLCKIIFGGDGSYFVTAPYHPHNRAIAAKVSVNYAREEQIFQLSDALDLAVVEDDQRRLKLSHHPDGFLQFSGLGIRSGRNPDGTAKGIGVTSWPLVRPTLGPSFGIAFSSPIACGRPSRPQRETVVLSEFDIEHMRPAGMFGLMITGYYFPVPWREFVYRSSSGEWWIDLIHPRAQAVKRLRVILASKDCEFPGFIGLEAQPHSVETDEQPGFIVSSSTGNLRRNEQGELIGDQLLCMYPAADPDNLDFRQLAYPLPSPAYVSPPGPPDEDATNGPP